MCSQTSRSVVLLVTFSRINRVLPSVVVVLIFKLNGILDFVKANRLEFGLLGNRGCFLVVLKLQSFPFR